MIAPNNSIAASIVLNIATKCDIERSEVYVVRPSGVPVWKNTPKLFCMNSDKRSWSAGTRSATRSCRVSNIASLAPQSWGILSPPFVPDVLSKNQFRRALTVLLEGDCVFKRSRWAASAESARYD